MNRRHFLASPALIPVALSAQRQAFAYRAWSFCIYSPHWDLLEDYVRAALTRADDYGINTFELHDYIVGNRGLVDAAVTYRDFPRLAAKDVLHYGHETADRATRERDYTRLRRLARDIKGKGLKLNCWYHVLRDAPAELAAEYPEIRDFDSGFYARYINGILREFFERVPEADRLTVTSLHETPSVIASPGTVRKSERLGRLYTATYDACHAAGRELIVRDFIVRAEDFEVFWDVLSKLPPDVYVMTKEVLADWVHPDMPLNPFLARYRGRKLIVEFDLYGEYWGRLDIPACYPEYLHRRIREIRALEVYGAVGRVVHEDQRSAQFATIFDSPNEINCFAFARYLSRRLPWLEVGGFTDPRERPGRWGWDLDAFDRAIWAEWAGPRYGPRALVPVVRALARTSRILPLIIDIGGRGFQAHSYAPGLRSIDFLWEPFCAQVGALGMDFLRDEKRQALAMTGQCLEDIRSARPVLSACDYEQLNRLFEGESLIIRSYAAVLEGYYGVYLAQRGDRRSSVIAAKGLDALATEVGKERGDTFFGRLPETLRTTAAWVREGKPPSRVTGS